jgi:hypothetical protein
MTELFPISKASAYLKVSKQYVYFLYKTGRLKAVLDRPLLFEKSELDRYLSEIKDKYKTDKRYRSLRKFEDEQN